MNLESPRMGQGRAVASMPHGGSIPWLSTWCTVAAGLVGWTLGWQALRGGERASHSHESGHESHRTAASLRSPQRATDSGESVSPSAQDLENLVRRRTESLRKTRDAVIFGLAKLAEHRDTDTGRHLDRIREYSMLLAKTLQSRKWPLSDEFVDRLGLASILHDIGKVGIPDEILLKPGRLTAEERAVMERHVTIGAECIESIKQRLGEDDFLQLALEIAACHHERFDGKGYPHRLMGHEIPLSAAIVSVADVYDALRSPRVYKAAMSHDEAKKLIVEGRGTQFHPEVVDAFLAVETRFDEIECTMRAPEEFPAAVNEPASHAACGTLEFDALAISSTSWARP